MKKHQQIKRKGFTLIELMLAVVLSSIIIFSCALMMTGLWRVNSRFMDEQITMDEIGLLTTAFQREAREKTSMSSSTTVDHIFFNDGSGNQSSFVYNANDNSVVYTKANGSQHKLLENSIVSGFSVIPNTTHTCLEMKLFITEGELQGKINEYSIIATTR